MAQQTSLRPDRVTAADNGARTNTRPRAGQSCWCNLASHTEQGPRESLEDALGAVMLCRGHHRIWGLAACDGVGGQDHGEVASEMGVQGICTLLPTSFALGSTENPLSRHVVRCLFLEIMAEINRTIVQRAIDDPALRGMCSTIVAALVLNGTLHCSWAGDSRCYLARANELEQLTRDHRQLALFQESSTAGDPGSALVRHAHSITQCLGNARSFVAEYTARELRDGDLILLCTDGLTDALTDEEIARHVAAWQRGECSLDGLPRRLAADALEAGTSDNVSILACAYEGSPPVVAVDEPPTRTGAYPAALAASFMHVRKEINDA